MEYRDFINNIGKMKESGDGLMSIQQYFSIGYTLAIKSPCNFLVFGLGEDSQHWKNLNNGGTTVFLEDSKEWIEKFKNSGLDIINVSYSTFAGDHEKIGFDTSLLEMNLPDSVKNTEWDIIMVDAPLGHGPPGRQYKGPGRMQSIYTAYQLLKPGGICIVDDMKRMIEQKYSLYFFGEENLINLIEEKVAIFKKSPKKIECAISDLVHNKRVALVGPAKYMKGSKLGEEIDSHDIVVRINRGIESTMIYPEDLGSRTDILYSCLIERAQQAGKIDPEKLSKEHGVKMVVIPTASDMKGQAKGDHVSNLIDTNTLNRVKECMPVYVIDHRLNNMIADQVQCKPNTGFLSIYDILSMEPSEFSIYGFSFYLDGFIPGQKKGVENEGKGSEQEFANMAFNSKRHVQKNMWNHAKKTLLNNPKIKLDSTLEKILNMETFDRDTFNKTVK